MGPALCAFLSTHTEYRPTVVISLYFLSVQDWNYIFVHNLMVSMRTVRINQMINTTDIIIHEKSGKGGRKGKRNKDRKILFMHKGNSRP